MSKLGKVELTNRGFEIIRFTDRSATACHLQQSSLADHMQPGSSAVWIGCDNPEPKVTARDAARLGVATDQSTGWVRYPLPEEVLVNTAVHLDREQVANLIASLTRWLKKGRFT